MPIEKQKLFLEPDSIIEMLEGIFERYHTDFSIKMALGASRYAAGEKSVRNSGYQAGNTLVSETTQEAYELLSDMCFGDNKRAVTLLGVTISCALASMGDLTPDHEDLICPQVMKIEPQVGFMPKDKRTPEHIMARIDEVSEQSWQHFDTEIRGKSHEGLVREARGKSGGYTIS